MQSSAKAWSPLGVLQGWINQQPGGTRALGQVSGIQVRWSPALPCHPHFPSDVTPEVSSPFFLQAALVQPFLPG